SAHLSLSGSSYHQDSRSSSHMYTYAVVGLGNSYRIAPSRSRRLATIRAESHSSRRATSRIVSPDRRALVGKCQPPASGVRIQTVRSPKNGSTIAIWAEAGGNSLKLESRRDTKVRSAIGAKVSRTATAASIAHVAKMVAERC